MPWRSHDASSSDALRRRLQSGALTWRGPVLILFARSLFAIAVQALVAALFVLRGSPTPWQDAEPWLPVYGTLIDAGCLAILWLFARREGIRLVDLVGFERKGVWRDAGHGLLVLPVYLAFILAGVFAAGWIVYGTLRPPYVSGPLPLPAVVYGVLVWPLIWGVTEQTTYNGYLLPRLQVLCRKTWIAVVCVAFSWSLQHAFMPLTFDPAFMTFRLLSAVPATLFATLLYLRLRRVLPLAFAHALMDAASVLVGAASG
jgi:hypothetical protein